MKASWLKITVSIVSLFSIVLTQPSFGKEAHAQHAKRTAARAPSKKTAAPASAAEANNAKGVKATEARPDDKIDAGVTVLTPRAERTPDKTRNLNSGLKITKPENVQARRVPTVGSPSPPVRNAIGQLLVRPESVTSAGHLGALMLRSTAASNGMIGSVHPAGIGGSNTAVQNPRALATASLPNHGGIDGVGLIRPAFATSGLGGPAKPVDGINGTTLHRKH